MLQLRPYQQEAVDYTYRFLRINDASRRPLIVLPTGTGKSLVIAQIADDVVEKRKSRALILAHRKELLEQIREKVPSGKVTTYSASLKEKDLSGDVVVGQIQSIYKHADKIGKIDAVLVDECHGVSTDDEGIFASFLNEIQSLHPNCRIIGFTATPYRMREGSIVDVREGPFHGVAYEYPVDRAVREGYLTPLVSMAPKCSANTDGVTIARGEYVLSEIESRVDNIISEACQDILARTVDRKSVLVFCVSVRHAHDVAKALGGECITGETPADERTKIIERFRNGQIKYLTNCDVLTTGFDAPNVDALAILRPTASRGLYIQICGRGMRLHPDKTDCLVLDYGRNIQRHGPIDAPYESPRKVWTKDSSDPATSVAKEWICPSCDHLNDNGYSQCQRCEFQRTRPTNHEIEAANEAIMIANGITPPRIEWRDVSDVRYFRHRSQKEGKPDSVCVEYHCLDGKTPDPVREWVCVQHQGFAQAKAVEWWAGHSKEKFPTNVSEFLSMAELGCVAKEVRIRVDTTEKWPRIIERTLHPIPERVIWDGDDPDDKWAFANYPEVDLDDLPF